jgi:hypothetical protein
MNEILQFLLCAFLILGIMKLGLMITDEFMKDYQVMVNAWRSKNGKSKSGKTLCLDTEYSIQRMHDAGWDGVNFTLEGEHICEIIPGKVLPNSAMVYLIVKIPESDIPESLKEIFEVK